MVEFCVNTRKLPEKSGTKSEEILVLKHLDPWINKCITKFYSGEDVVSFKKIIRFEITIFFSDVGRISWAF
jgi:hypothetical protein